MTQDKNVDDDEFNKSRIFERVKSAYKHLEAIEMVVLLDFRFLKNTLHHPIQ